MIFFSTLLDSNSDHLFTRHNTAAAHPQRAPLRGVQRGRTWSAWTFRLPGQLPGQLPGPARPVQGTQARTMRRGSPTPPWNPWTMPRPLDKNQLAMTTPRPLDKNNRPLANRPLVGANEDAV